MSIAFADFIDADARLYVLNGSNATVRGYMRMDNTSGVNNTNVTGHFGNSNFTVFTNTSRNWTHGFFEFNLTSSNTTGRYNVSINGTLPNGTLIREDIEIRVGHLANVTFNFTNRRPPFANGSYFELNISFSGRTMTVAPPKLEIFNPNGVNSSSWVINNITSRIETNSILYNITVPAAADGRYVIVFDEGVGSTVFLVKSGIVIVVNTQDAANSTTTNFGQGESIRIVAKVRDENNPITTATVTAFVTLPNGTVASQSLSHSSITNGTYIGTFTNTALSGTYSIEVVANASGKIVKATTAATVQSLEGRLDIVKDFFFDFGSQSAFQRGGRVDFNVLVYNLSNDVMLNGSITTNSGADVNCTAIRSVELKNVLNSSTEPSPFLTRSLGLFVGQNVCKINFTAPNLDGVYSLTVNASVGASQTNNLSVLATGYFAVQSYILKPSPVSSFGGGKEFMSFLMPGDNATFELSVRNLSSNGTAVDGANITNFNVTRIMPMSFTGGGETEITNLTGLTGAFTAGTATSNPRVVVRLPENRTGPFQIEFQASVAGSVIRGTAFYIARYVEGFVFPASFGGGFGTGGPGEGPGGGDEFAGGNFRCSGAQNFSAKIFDVRTRQAARNVVFNSIKELREEFTGRDVRSSVVLSSSTLTDSNGFGNLTLNFTDSSLSGFYFMLVNITTNDGKQDTLPGGFECRQLSFFPQIKTIGSTGSFFVAPTSGLTVEITGIKNLNTGNSTVNGTVNIVRFESFDPSKGPKFVAGLTDSFPILNGVVNITLYPTNFSSLGGKWFNGFNDFVIRVCDNINNTNAADDVCDTSFGGFMVVAFDAFPDFMFGGPPSALIAGQNATYNIMARTNVTNSTPFTVQVGLPWEGSVVDAVVVNYSLRSDGWNNSNHTGWDNFERWNVTFTVPANLRKGGNLIIIKVNNYLGESTDVMLFATASKLSISVPDTEGIFEGFNFFVNASNSTDTNARFRTNLTAIRATHNVSSRSDTVCIITDFNITRFGPGGDQRVSYGRNVTIAVLDNATAGVFDTLVINKSGTIGVANATGVRSLQSGGFAGLYLVEVKECGFVKLLNSTITESSFGAGFGGQHAVNTIATIPFLVKQGATARPNVVIDVYQVIKQEDFGGGRGGFGFTEFLPSSNYTKTPAATDSNGVMFLRINVSRSGLYSILWNFTDGTDSDVADFSEGVGIEIKSFRTDMDSGSSSYAPRVINLTLNTSENVLQTGSSAYVGTWNESLQGELFDTSSASQFFYIALRNVTQTGDMPQVLSRIRDSSFNYTELVIDNDDNLNTSNALADTDGLRAQDYSRNWTGDFSFPGTPSSYKVDGNRTVSSTVLQLAFGMRDYIFNSISSSTTRVQRNVTVRACAFTFNRPETPLIGANVSNVTTQSFSMGGPPTTESLNIYDPFTGANVTSVLTGPSGCATFNVSRSGGWTAGFPNEIKGVITSGGSSEQAWLGNVFVFCSSGCTG